MRGVAFGAVAGVLAGVASFVFLEALDRVTDTRLDHPWLLYVLPVAGLVVGLAYHHLGGRAARGNSLLIEEIHRPTDWVPRRMAPLVLIGTLVSHLFGASVGREGTAIQMSGSLSDGLARVFRLEPGERRTMLIAAIAGGFGSVFGVPLAGAVFALEVQAVGRVRYDALAPALAASVVGDLVVEALGHRHAPKPRIDVEPTAATAGKVAVAGVAFGLAALAFVLATDAVRAAARRVPWPPLRTVVGGVATVLLALVVGREYLGLSLPLIDQALAGDSLSLADPALKIALTAIALGTGFPGGEVTPLFVTGATLGAALAPTLGLPVPVLAAGGFVAVFGAAANTPLACTIMAVELFGGDGVALFAIACVVAYVVAPHRGIYATQLPPETAGAARVEG